MHSTLDFQIPKAWLISTFGLHLLFCSFWESTEANEALFVVCWVFLGDLYMSGFHARSLMDDVYFPFSAPTTEEASLSLLLLLLFFAHPSLFFCRGAQGLLIEIGCSGSSPEFTSIHHEGVVNLSKLRFIPWRKQGWKSFMNNFPFLGVRPVFSELFVGFWFCCFMKNGGYDFCSIAPPTTNVSIISKEQSRWTNPLDFAWMNPWIKAQALHSVNILLPIFHEVQF